MEKLLLVFIIFFSALPASSQTSGGVGIGTQTPDPTALLHLSSVEKGLLIPRMSAAQRSAIVNPATGLQVYQTDGIPGLCYFDGSRWVNASQSEALDSDGLSDQYGFVSTFAGSTHPSGSAGEVNGRGTTARFVLPSGVGVDKAGSLYIADQGSLRIRKATPEGMVSALAGGDYGRDDGAYTNAKFEQPTDVAVDGTGNIFVTDNCRIRKITPEGQVSTIAGSIPGDADGTGANAQFGFLTGIQVDPAGHIYVVDNTNCKIRKVFPDGRAITLAGSNSGNQDGVGALAKFGGPIDLALDTFGNLFVSDAINNSIRKVTASGEVTTITGEPAGAYMDGPLSSARFLNPFGITVDEKGNIYVADSGNHNIRKISTAGIVSTVAGLDSGYSEGKRSQARFVYPYGITISRSGALYVSESNRSRIRKVLLDPDITQQANLANVNTSSITTSWNGTGSSNMLAVAFGSVSAGATDSLLSSSENCSLSHTPGSGIYTIKFSSNLAREFIGNLPVMVSLSGSAPGLISYTGNSSGLATLTIRTFNTQGSPADRGFSFTIYRP